MALRWGHWQPRDEDPEMERLWALLLNRICPQPLVTVLEDGRVTLDDRWLDELALEDLEEGLRRAELRRTREDRRRPWLESLIRTLSTHISAAHTAIAREKAAPVELRWGPEEQLEVAPPLPKKPKNPRFHGAKGGR